MQWKIAAAQMEVTDDIARNVDAMMRYIERAAARSADIICFPETCLVNDRRHVRSITDETRRIKRAAKDHDIHVIFGTYVREENGHIRNQIWVIDRSGNLVYRYSKRNPYITERTFLKVGRKNKVLELDGVRFAVINCWDYAFPEHIRMLARKGARIIFCPSYIMSHGRTRKVIEHIPQVRAFDAMSYFVMVDAYAEDSFKRSKICHPLRTLARIRDEPGLIFARVSPDEITELRDHYHNLSRFVPSGNGGEPDMPTS